MDKGKWVEKDWGRERILVNNERYCAKLLYVDPGWQCSLHRHKIKDETFLVRIGSVLLEEFGVKGFQTMYEGDTKRILPGHWHRFANYGIEVAVILEISTHHDDADVERRERSRRISGR